MDSVWHCTLPVVIEQSQASALMTEGQGREPKDLKTLRICVFCPRVGGKKCWLFAEQEVYSAKVMASLLPHFSQSFVA